MSMRNPFSFYTLRPYLQKYALKSFFMGIRLFCFIYLTITKNRGMIKTYKKFIYYTEEK